MREKEKGRERESQIEIERERQRERERERERWRQRERERERRKKIERLTKCRAFIVVSDLSKGGKRKKHTHRIETDKETSRGIFLLSRDRLNKLNRLSHKIDYHIIYIQPTSQMLLFNLPSSSSIFLQFYSILLYYILLYSILLYSTLFCSILFYSFPPSLLLPHSSGAKTLILKVEEDQAEVVYGI